MSTTVPNSGSVALGDRTRARVRRRVKIVPHRDERVALYATLAVAAALLGALDGGLRIVLVGIPFATTLVLGLRNREPVTATAEVTLDATRCIEGDAVEGRIDIDAPPGYAVELAVERTTDDLRPVDERPWAWSIPTSVERPVGVPFAVLGDRWCRASPGRLVVRLVDHGSLLSRREPTVDIPPITVLPDSVRLDELVRLDRPPAVAGAHPARSVLTGGYDFAEVRDYQPGDRLRDLNWSASLRRDEPAVNHRFPERAGNVVVVIDTFPDALRHHASIARDVTAAAGRLVWAIIRPHLRANDRVGLLVEGSRPTWLAPSAGRRAEYAIFDAMLRATASSMDHVPGIAVREHPHLPAGATIVAVTPLARPASMERIIAWRIRGHRVVAVAIDIDAALRRDVPALPDAVRRLRRLTFEERVAALRRHGIEVGVAGVGDEAVAAFRSIVRHPRGGAR